MTRAKKDIARAQQYTYSNSLLTSVLNSFVLPSATYAKALLLKHSLSVCKSTSSKLDLCLILQCWGLSLQKKLFPLELFAEEHLLSPAKCSGFIYKTDQPLLAEGCP